MHPALAAVPLPPLGSASPSPGMQRSVSLMSISWPAGAHRARSCASSRPSPTSRPPSMPMPSFCPAAILSCMPDKLARQLALSRRARPGGGAGRPDLWRVRRLHGARPLYRRRQGQGASDGGASAARDELGRAQTVPGLPTPETQEPPALSLAPARATSSIIRRSPNRSAATTSSPCAMHRANASVLPVSESAGSWAPMPMSSIGRTALTRAIMLQGTGSNVGKSLIAAGLARAFANRGLKVRPFKPQNMSNNAAVTIGWRRNRQRPGASGCGRARTAPASI